MIGSGVPQAHVIGGLYSALPGHGVRGSLEHLGHQDNYGTSYTGLDL